MSKVRVSVVAKELGKTSKEVLAWLAENGEYVKSAASQIEAPTVRRLKEAFPRQSEVPAIGLASAQVQPVLVGEDRELPRDQPPVAVAEAQVEHVEFPEGTTGVSYYGLFAAHLGGARRIEIIDPYIWNRQQVLNLLEFLEAVVYVDLDDREYPSNGIEVRLVTLLHKNPTSQDSQRNWLETVSRGAESCGVNFAYEFSKDRLHARSIVTDTGWKMVLERGLDIYKPHSTDPLMLVTRIQELRETRSFYVTYLRP